MYNDEQKWNSSSRGRYSTPSNENGRHDGESRQFSRENRGEQYSRPSFNPSNASQNGQRRQRQRIHRPNTYQANSTQEQPTYASRPSFKSRDNDFHRDRRSFSEDGNRSRNFRGNRTNTTSRNSVYSKKKQFEYQQKHEDPTKPIRLNKFLANAGICSRREADDFIQAGVITVNGEVVTALGTKVLPTDKVMFHEQPIRRERKVYLLLNKPKNTVTTTDDPQERHTVMDIVQNACSERIYPVGRLDRNTTGVLLLTNDGDLAAKLTHPHFGKKKVYAVTLDHDLSADDEEMIRTGIMLDDELIVPDALEFTKDDRRHIGLEIHSGQNRVVRRIFEKVGYKVMQLDRVSFAGLTKKNLPRGKYRFLTPKEVNMLMMGAFE